MNEVLQGKEKEKPGAVIHASKNQFVLAGDINALLERVITESVPHSRDEKSADQLRQAQVFLAVVFRHDSVGLSLVIYLQTKPFFGLQLEYVKAVSLD